MCAYWGILGWISYLVILAELGLSGAAAVAGARAAAAVEGGGA